MLRIICHIFIYIYIALLLHFDHGERVKIYKPTYIKFKLKWRTLAKWLYYVGCWYLCKKILCVRVAVFELKKGLPLYIYV